MDHKQATDRFLPFTLSDEATERLRQLRHGFIGLAAILTRNAPDSREKSLAMTKLEESSFWAAAAISRHQDPDPS